MKDLVDFRLLITPLMLRIAWLVGSGLIVLSGLVAMVRAGSIGGATLAIIASACGLLAYRVVCELLVLLFGIHDLLRSLADRSHDVAGGGGR